MDTEMEEIIKQVDDDKIKKFKFKSSWWANTIEIEFK